MARIAGVDLPKNKTVEYGLTAIYGAMTSPKKNKVRFVISSKTNTPWKVSSARKLP